MKWRKIKETKIKKMPINQYLNYRHLFYNFFMRASPLLNISPFAFSKWADATCQVFIQNLTLSLLLKNYFLLPLAIHAGYHFSNHTVKIPINTGIKLFTMISTFPNPAFRSRKVQTAVSTYNDPHAAARI